MSEFDSPGLQMLMQAQGLLNGLIYTLEVIEQGNINDDALKYNLTDQQKAEFLLKQNQQTITLLSQIEDGLAQAKLIYMNEGK